MEYAPSRTVTIILLVIRLYNKSHYSKNAQIFTDILAYNYLLHFLSCFQISMSDDFEQTSLFTSADSNTSAHLCNLYLVCSCISNNY